MTFKFLLFVSLLVGFAALAYAGFDEGMAAYDRGDYAKAYKEFKPLAEQGDADSQFYLGVMYDFGRGVSQDYIQAMKWFRRAAEQGDDEAQFELGWAYANGKSVPQDFIQAYMWFSLAEAHEDVTYAEDYAGDFRDSLAEKMTPAQIAEALRLARVWKPKGRD
jgi:TPR repeat protein